MKNPNQINILDGDQVISQHSNTPRVRRHSVILSVKHIPGDLLSPKLLTSIMFSPQSRT